ncbi:30S ribosomal protein S21 [Candidatus Berkelbacteria bacterium RBG_13_40_8]|uniref:Small ribosomal subunit protein bS21 n=1 Tax=Candidatus Berkelbacteria bacterium RBG_13_40_8 TaxID=1797467 RepID=A0A1F5DLV1_9BACT|nr:MAG: 30S ribosomal protein S21 [Candidatus Berkelbacteria bacterium RBG_13_40_8]
MDTNQKTDYRNNRERGKGENFDVTLRRFFRDVQQSGILTEIKKRKFHSKEVSRDKRRISARRKAQVRKIKRGY